MNRTSKTRRPAFIWRALVVLLPVLVQGCTSTTGTYTRPANVPRYAIYVGQNAEIGVYVVECGGSSITVSVTPDDSDFLKEDGTLRTMREFCSAYNPTSRIRRE